MNASAAARGSRALPPRATVAMLVGVGLLTLMDAGMKLLTGHYPPVQVAALRSVTSLPLVLVWALLTVGAAPLLRVRWSLQLARGGLGVVMIAGFTFALRRLPLSTVYAIFFVTPLLITALSAWLLGEHVGARRWTAVATGLVGVLVVLRPTAAGVLSVAGGAVLVAALGYALAAICVRKLAATDTTQAMVVWLLLSMTIGTGFLAAPHWQPLRTADLWLIVGVGVVGLLAQIAMTEAFRLGEASALAPLEYTALVWGVLLDVSLWGVLPDAPTWIGAAIVIFSGLYLMRRERAAGRRPVRSENPSLRKESTMSCFIDRLARAYSALGPSGRLIDGPAHRPSADDWAPDGACPDARGRVPPAAADAAVVAAPAAHTCPSDTRGVPS